MIVCEGAFLTWLQIARARSMYKRRGSERLPPVSAWLQGPFPTSTTWGRGRLGLLSPLRMNPRRGYSTSRPTWPFTSTKHGTRIWPGLPRLAKLPSVSCRGRCYSRGRLVRRERRSRKNARTKGRWDPTHRRAGGLLRGGGRSGSTVSSFTTKLHEGSCGKTISTSGMMLLSSFSCLKQRCRR